MMTPASENLSLLHTAPPNWRGDGIAALPGFLIALSSTVMVAALDYVTGYELRLAILYLAPIALATWTGGRLSGIAIVTTAGLCWLLSFHSTHSYSRQIYYDWEAAVMVASFLTFVLLLARLRVALTHADERFLRLLEEMHAGVYVVDNATGRVLYANRRASSTLGAITPPRPAAGFERPLPAPTAVSAPTAPATGAQDPESCFVSQEARDEQSGCWYLLQSGPIPWGPGQHVTLKVITDITEQKQAQSLRRQHQEMLHHTAKLAGLAEIASTLAHEINQPLMAIASYNDACLRLLRSSRCDANELASALEKSRGQAVRAGLIISRMREFIRQRHSNPVDCDISSLVTEAMDLMASHLEDAQLSVDLALEDGLPTVLADRTLLIQVMVNLIQNAMDAMRSNPPAHRRLSVSASRESAEAVLVSVTDWGEGIPDANLAKLYTPFFTTRPQGLGLGLSICRSVIDAHGGRLWSDARPGGGCIFRFTLPIGMAA